MSSWADRAYPRLPIALQNLACSAHGWREARVRYSRHFDEQLSALVESDRWSAAEIRAYQDERLRLLVARAFANVPYYRDKFRELKLHPSDIRGVEDLAKLPILTKEDVRLAGDRLRDQSEPRRNLVEMHTSGTTGKSLHFFVTKQSIALRWAVWWRHRVRFGVEPFSWHANFTGKQVVPPEQDQPPYWRWNLPMRQVLFNMHHMVPEKIGDIADLLNSRDLVYYAGYPSVIHAFVQCLSATGATLQSKPKFVFTGAENMLDFQRADIAAATGALLTDQYGFSEGCGNASQCEKLVYHEDFEFGVLECLDPSPPDEHGNVRGKIVATGFASPAFPFIRYEVGDVGVWAPAEYSCGCGRASRVLQRIEGRMDDYVITPEGRRIMRFDYVFKDTLSVKESQIIQRKQGEITVLVVRRPEFSVQDEARIRAEIASWISPRLQVSFEYVDEIPREANGKFRAVKTLLS